MKELVKGFEIKDKPNYLRGLGVLMYENKKYYGKNEKALQKAKRKSKKDK